jgi:hypothetical protein
VEQKFRDRFFSLQELLQMIVDSSENNNQQFFKGWRKIEESIIPMSITRKTSPLELLLLGALQYLGRGFTFDDVEDDTFISVDVHCCFFHSFTKWDADFLYNTYVWMPDSVAEVTECEEAYRIAGLPGCIGSSDATHVALKKVRHFFAMLTLDSNPKPQQELTILV